MQTDAFNTWEYLVSRAVLRWQRKQARSLLELVRQVIAEEELFLDKQNNQYGQYLIGYSWFLKQEAHWDDARIILQEALLVFEQGENLSGQAISLNNIGAIYDSQGQL